MIKLFNTLSRKKEALKPIHPRWVGLYACGPTVYDFAHIGNLRTYIFEDVLSRTLAYGGYRVKQIMNITDVDDKIIRASRKARKTISEFVKPYTKAFFADLAALNIKKAWKYPRATGHIKEMIKITGNLLKRRVAYKAEDGSIYFSVSKFKPYGKLSHAPKINFKHGARVDADEYGKEERRDFALWKAAKPGEPSWEAPFGKGRPGWHIECSAMSIAYLGQPFDIHAGGVDLIFPHHENEIAQSESAEKKMFVRYWIHGEHLLINGEKMSKSLKNTITLRDIESRGINPLAFRYLVLTAHYRSKLNFTWKSLKMAQESLERIYAFVLELKQTVHGLALSSKKLDLKPYEKSFGKALSDDLNTPTGLALIWKLMREYRKNPSRYDPEKALELLYCFDKILGLEFMMVKPEKIPAEIHALVQKREEYRKKKQWKEADAIRKKISEEGYLIEDAAQGPKLKYR